MGKKQTDEIVDTVPYGTAWIGHVQRFSTHLLFPLEHGLIPDTMIVGKITTNVHAGSHSYYLVIPNPTPVRSAGRRAGRKVRNLRLNEKTYNKSRCAFNPNLSYS